MIFGERHKLLFIGDSITDCGRRAEPYAPYGNGYVHLTRAFLLARYPALGLHIVNRGIGGNTVRDLAARWQQDALAERPDWLSIKIGINDAWRTLAGRSEEAVLVDEYERTYRALLTQVKERTDARLIMMDPYVIAPPLAGDPVAVTGKTLTQIQLLYADLRQRGVSNGAEFDATMVHFRALIDQYIAVVEQLAGDCGALHVRTQAAFDEAIQGQPPSFWAQDRVHPGAPGHAVIARAFLRAVGYGDA